MMNKENLTADQPSLSLSTNFTSLAATGVAEAEGGKTGEGADGVEVGLGARVGVVVGLVEMMLVGSARSMPNVLLLLLLLLLH